MQHEAELLFFMEILKNSHMPCHIIRADDETAGDVYDFGLRRLIIPELNYREQFLRYCRQYRPGVLYRIRDPLLCRYYLFQLPDADLSYVLVGPYTESEITTQDIMNLMERYVLSPHFLRGNSRTYSGSFPSCRTAPGCWCS